jgi:hypothetical protein
MVLKDGGDNQITHRMAQVAKHLLSGWDVRIIARHVGCSVSTAWHDIQLLRAGWMEEAKATFAEHQAQELARVDTFMAMAVARNDLKLAVKCCELRCRLLGLLKPKVAVVVPPVPWDEIQRAANAAVEDTIEERLAQASIPHLEARLNGQGSREDAGAGEAAGGA